MSAKIQLSDLELLTELSVIRSVRELARRKSTSPSQISKAIQKVELIHKVQIFERSVKGLTLTQAGNELIRKASKLIQAYEEFNDPLKRAPAMTRIAGTAFLLQHVSAPALFGMQKKQTLFEEASIFRFIEMPPDQMIPAGLRGAFDICFHFDDLDWPKTWDSELIGTMKWHLVAAKNNSEVSSWRKISTLVPKYITRSATIKMTMNLPMIVPIYWTPDGISYGKHPFSNHMSKRKAGSETSTIDNAILLIIDSDEIAFLPELILHKKDYTEKIQIIQLSDFPVVERKLYMSYRTDNIRQKQKKMIFNTIKDYV